MRSNNCRGYIQLVYSSAARENDILNPESQIFDKGWEQFELFVSEKPDVMIFAQPDQLGFDGIVQIVAVGNARRIFDLREVPFISFGNESRESFLRVLMKNRVEYFNIFQLRHKLSKKEDYDENKEETYFSFEQEEVKRVLKPMIESGPTVVFSDCAPSGDKAIKRLLDLLLQAEISYSPVYADNG